MLDILTSSHVSLIMYLTVSYLSLCDMIFWVGQSWVSGHVAFGLQLANSGWYDVVHHCTPDAGRSKNNIGPI